MSDDMKSIVFPPMDTAKEAKFKRLFESMSELLGTDITMKTVIVIEAQVPSDQVTAIRLIGRLRDKQKEIAKVEAGKPPEKKKPLEVGESAK